MATLSGGKKLEDALRKIGAGLGRGAVVRVGFLEGATYPVQTAASITKQRAKLGIKAVATRGRTGGKSVPMIAAIQEFGAPRAGIPPRPFFRNMIAEKKGEWPAGIAEQLRANDYDVVRTLDIVGAVIAGQLRQSIIETNTPPLAESTIRRKGFSKPLVDTGHMLNSIDHEVTSS